MCQGGDQPRVCGKLRGPGALAIQNA
jgi:hypothetical protein